MSATTPTVQKYALHRHTIPLSMTYDRALQRVSELVPAIDTGRFDQAADLSAATELAAINAPHGFMRYWTSDVTALMAGSPSGWRCTEYLFGNHIIAERMFRHDPAVMLNAPLRAVLYVDQDGDTYLAVDRPSDQFASFEQPEIAAVGRELDALLGELVKRLGGAFLEVPISTFGSRGGDVDG